MTRPIAQSGEPAPCPTCGNPAQKLVSSFASKADYTVKVPTKEPFRAPMSSGAASGGARTAAKPTSSRRGAGKK